SCSQPHHVDGLLLDQPDGFTLALLDSLFSKGLRTVKSIHPKCRLGFSRALKGALDMVICKPDDISCWVSLLVLPLCLLKTFYPMSNLECKSANKRKLQEESIINAIRSWGVSGGSWQLVRETLVVSAPPMLDLDKEDLDLCERNLKQCKRKICDGHYTAAVRVLSSSGVAPYNDATLQELKAKHPFKSATSLPGIPIDHQHLIASQDVVLDRIKSFPRGTSYGRDGLRAQHLMDCLSRAAIAISDELLSSITQVVNLFLEGKCPTRLGEYIASAHLTPLIKPGGGIRPIAAGTVGRRMVSKVSATMIDHSLDGYLDGLQFGVGVPGGGEAIMHAVNRLVEDRGDDVGILMLLVDFQNAFNLVDRTVMLQEVRLHCPAISHWVEFCYSSPARLYYGEHSLWSWQGVQQVDPLGPLLFSLVLHPLVCKIRDSFDLCLHAWYLDDGTVAGDTLVVERIVTASGPGFRDWQWRLATLPFAFGGLGIYSTCDVLNYAFIASRLQSDSLQTKLLRHVGIVVSGSTLEEALYGLMAMSKGGSHFRLASCGSDFWVGTDYERISTGKEVDIGLDGGNDKKLRPTDMLLYSWDRGLDVCVDLTESSPLTQTGMTDFATGRVVSDAAHRMTDFATGRVVSNAAHRKRSKYMAKCAAIGYGFLPFSFTSLGELKADAVTLLKRIQKFSMAQDIGARAAIHIFNRISFVIAKGVGAQIVSRLPSNLL
nr:hypothetical protein [Tanacetum cinerariifolium]